ncbi:hypothetical protein SAMN05660485_03724 [Blastococcus fimeti]|nr:hypothetical protein SAMN05660485_03724 [Blastococcus fimeti]
MIRPRGAAALCALVVATGAACGAQEPEPTAQEPLPTVSVAESYGTDTITTADELVANSYVVARGRFVGAPDIVLTQHDEDVVGHVVVWEFAPDEVYRDVRLPDAPSRQADERRGTFLVAAGAYEIGAMRGELSVEAFIGSRPSTYNLNSYVVDRPVHVFLRPGVVPREVVQQRPELADVWTLAGTGHCYAVEDLAESCAYVSDTVGGEPAATVELGSLTPPGLTTEAVEGSGSVPDVVGSETFAESQPIDVGRYRVLPAPGGEG